MATYYGNSNNGYYLKLDVSESSVNIANNTSYLSWSLYLVNGSKYFSGRIDSASGYVNGSHVWSGMSSLSIDGPNRETLLYSNAATIAHNSDGSKTVGLSFTFSASSGGWGAVGLGVSASFPMTTIPRASTVTISNSTPKYGEQVQLTINSAVSSFTHKIQVGANGHISWTTIADGVKGAVNWTVPKDFANSYTTTDNVLWLYITTYNSGTLIGEKYYYTAFKLQPSDDMLPTGSVSISDGNTQVKNAFGVFCKDLSKLACVINSKTEYGASLQKVLTTVEEITYTGSEFTTKELTKSGAVELSTVITDSRGATTTVKNSVNVYDYKKPVIKGVTFNQDNSNIQIEVKGAIDSVNNRNSKKLVIKYKPKTEQGNWSQREVYLNSWDFIANTTISNLDTSLTYNIKVELSDKLFTVESETTTGIPVISRLAGGKGVRFFGDAYEEGFMVDDVHYDFSEDFKNRWKSKLGGVVSLETILDKLLEDTVETGEIEGWKYEKYPSGLIFLDRMLNGTIAFPTVLGGNISESNLIRQSLPAGLLKTVEPLFLASPATANGCWPVNCRAEPGMIAFYLVNEVRQPSSINFSVYVRVKGTWK